MLCPTYKCFTLLYESHARSTIFHSSMFVQTITVKPGSQYDVSYITLHYISAIFNALYATLCTLEETQVLFQRHKRNVLTSGQEILAQNWIVSLVLKSQRNVTYTLTSYCEPALTH